MPGTAGGGITPWSAVGAGLFLTSIPVVAWGAYMRVDMMGLAFSLGGLLALSPGVPLWAGLLFSLAILSKQSMLAALFGASLFLAARRRWRDLGLLLLATSLPVAAVCAWQMIATEGGFLFHAVKANGVEFSVTWALRYYWKKGCSRTLRSWCWPSRGVVGPRDAQVAAAPVAPHGLSDRRMRRRADGRQGRSGGQLLPGLCRRALDSGGHRDKPGGGEGELRSLYR